MRNLLAVTGNTNNSEYETEQQEICVLLWVYYMLGNGYVMFSVEFICLIVCLPLCLSVSHVTQMLRMDFDEILWRCPDWYN